MEGLLVDIDGVLAVSWQPIPGAVEAVEALRAAGVPMRFVTNTTSRTRAAVADALADAGFPIGPDDILTAPAATAAYLRARHAGARCLLLNSGDVAADLADAEVTFVPAGSDDVGDVDVVVVGGAGPEFSYEALNQVFDRVLEGAPLVAMHRNQYWRTERGFQLDTGAYVRAIEFATGVTATVLGKPSPVFFTTALDQLGLAAARTAMVGDDIDSDVLAAQACGLRGVLVRTGKFRPEVLAHTAVAPDVVVDSFADVPALLR